MKKDTPIEIVKKELQLEIQRLTDYAFIELLNSYADSIEKYDYFIKENNLDNLILVLNNDLKFYLEWKPHADFRQTDTWLYAYESIRNLSSSNFVIDIARHIFGDNIIEILGEYTYNNYSKLFHLFNYTEVNDWFNGIYS